MHVGGFLRYSRYIVQIRTPATCRSYSHLDEFIIRGNVDDKSFFREFSIVALFAKWGTRINGFQQNMPVCFSFNSQPVKVKAAEKKLWV